MAGCYCPKAFVGCVAFNDVALTVVGGSFGTVSSKFQGPNSFINVSIVTAL